MKLDAFKNYHTLLYICYVPVAMRET